MSIFKRFRDITVATINEALDKVEDPVAMLNQYMRDMESEISRAEVAIARQNAMEKRWRALTEEMEHRASKRTRQAELAVDTGDDEIALRALSDKEYCLSKIEEYRRQHETAKEQKRQLLEQLQELKDKYYELRSKKFALVARVNVAQATKQMNSAMSAIDTDSAAKGFSRIEERVMMMEADADASRSLRTTFQPDHFGRTSFAYSEKVEAELAKIKAAKKGAVEEKDGPTSLS
ncbi:PspA/IM30 family protein [Numidum massiliense]|uniref:PspA/IM30 family protein n=1 Tax=Numidum massiliense TaxID=1522315 RepID=UPI0006D573BF|nr:PspA/IM30 family protein [Numidum massiliense]